MTRRRFRPALLAALLLAVALGPLPSAAQETSLPSNAPAPSPTPPPSAAASEAPTQKEAAPEASDLAKALEEIRNALGLSAFFDVKAADRNTDPNVFSMGDFELDFARELGKSVQVAAAVVVNDDGAELAVGFVDVHVVGAPIAPRGRLQVEKGFHAQIGRFDVPFGGDWQYFAAKDRTEITAPLTTEVVLDGGYNDTGIRFLGGTESFGWSGYWLRGQGEGTAIGGRLVFMPFHNQYRLKERVRSFELGVSALHDFDGESGTESTSFAVDAELFGPFGRLRGEYARHDERAAEGGEGRFVKSGLHLTAYVDAGSLADVPLTPYVRWDTADLDPEIPTDEAVPGRTNRLTAGLNALFFDVASLKLEYQRTLSAPDEVEAAEDFHRDAFLAQVVVSF